MWAIFERKGLQRTLAKMPLEIKKRYEKWKDIVRISGPAGLRSIKGFHDESLKGKWAAHRSSRLSDKYRVIYFEEEGSFIVKVIDVTAHDYRRK